MITQAQLIQKLRREAERTSQAEVAARLGVTPAYLSDVLKGKRNPGPTILKKMGYVKVNMYQETE